MIDHPPLLLLYGPTASGKSGLALELAERTGGVIVNADALQVYDCWQVLTARPDRAARARVPHLLDGFLPAEAAYSAGQWARDLATLLGGIRRPAIICGGTGLYFHTIVNGLSPIPDVSPEIRAEGDALRLDGGAAAFAQLLGGRDPASLARIGRTNTARLQRAWEVWRQTGRPLSAWRETPGKPLINHDYVRRVVLSPDPPVLRERIERRFRGMMDGGAVEEVRSYLSAGHDLAAPAGKALGARDIAAMLTGAVSVTDAEAAAVGATQRYAKRQRTWARGQMKDWTWAKGPADLRPLLSLWPG
jgi:tRNA dimethylallyltransferase